MRLFIDDIRVCPPGWVQARDYLAAITVLSTGRVVEVSFDHDLGQGKSGYDVICWLEKAVANGVVPIPKMAVHTNNPPGRKQIQACISAMQRRVQTERNMCPHLAYGQCTAHECKATGFGDPRALCQKKELTDLTKQVLLEAEVGVNVETADAVDRLFEELDDPATDETPAEAEKQSSWDHVGNRAARIIATWPKWKQEAAQQIMRPIGGWETIDDGKPLG